MNWAEDLNLHVDALLVAMESDKKFFAPVMHYVKALKRSLSPVGAQVSKSSLVTPARKIKDFWDSYKPSDTPGSFYIPPAETSNTADTVDEIYDLVMRLTDLPDDEFAGAFQSSQQETTARGSDKTPKANRPRHKANGRHITINIQGNVGAFNLGTVLGDIAAAVNLLEQQGNENIATGLKAIAEAIGNDQNTANVQVRLELLEAVAFIGEQANLPPEKRKRTLLNSTYESLKTGIALVGSGASIWQLWGQQIATFLGLSLK